MAGVASPISGLLVDSDVLIWILHGNARAIAQLKVLADWHISAVSYM